MPGPRQLLTAFSRIKLAFLSCAFCTCVVRVDFASFSASWVPESFSVSFGVKHNVPLQHRILGFDDNLCHASVNWFCIRLLISSSFGCVTSCAFGCRRDAFQPAFIYHVLDVVAFARKLCE